MSPNNMSDSNPPNHWDALLAELGAAAPAPEPQPPPPSPPAAQPAFPSRPMPRTPRVSRGPTRTLDWDVLANELGVPLSSEDLKPKPVEPKVQAAGQAPPSRAKQEEARSTKSRGAAADTWHRRGFAQLFRRDVQFRGAVRSARFVRTGDRGPADGDAGKN